MTESSLTILTLFPQQENVDVEQRNMQDPVLAGIAWGVFIAVFVVFGGTLAVSTNNYEWFTYGTGLFFWNLVLTALMLGLFIHTYIITNYLSQLPSQKDAKVV